MSKARWVLPNVALLAAAFSVFGGLGLLVEVYTAFIPPVTEWAAWGMLILVAGATANAVLAVREAGKGEGANARSTCTLLVLAGCWPLGLVIGQRPDKDTARVAAGDVEDLFLAGPKHGINLGDGVVDVECEPANPRGLGTPWTCKLETDSEGNVTLRARISEDGRFRSEGGSPGCCVPVANP